jgi:predicted kinase
VPALVVLAGLPGVGKTTVARLLARRQSAVYLRIDAIEQALLGAGVPDVGPAGYTVAFALAAENLRLGRCVVADAVNALRVTRQAWSDVAAKAACRFHLVEIVCSEEAEHRRRVASRMADIPGHVLPVWDAVAQRGFEPISGALCVIDTAVLTPEQSVATILAAAGPVGGMNTRNAAEG